MPLVADRCICLRKTEFSETSQILTLLSRDHGIFRAMAKGAHRKTKAGASRFDGGIDLLDTGHAVFSSDNARELQLLTDWKLEEGHLNLRRNLRPLFLAIYAAELVSLLFEEHDPHPEVFDQLEQILSDLATPRLEESFLAFQLDLLRHAGFIPEFAACVNCQNPIDEKQPVSFAPSRGGVLCRNCQPGFPDRLNLDPRLLRLLQIIQAPIAAGIPRRLPILTRHQTDPLNHLLLRHLEISLGRRPRSAYYVLPRRPVATTNAPDNSRAIPRVKAHNS